jgi:integrase
VTLDEKLEAFAAWLTKEGYAASTVEDSVRTVRQLDRDAREGVESGVWIRPQIKRIRTGAKALGWAWPAAVVAQLRSVEQRAASAAETPKARRAAAQRAAKRRQSSYDDASWAKLARRVASDAGADPACAVLDVMISTGLRVGDVLSLERHALVPSEIVRLTQKGGSERFLPWDDCWGRLDEVWSGSGAANVASLVSPGGDGSPVAGHAAYRRVELTLKRLAKELALPGRAHLHRLRRTVAVQVIRTTGDLEVARHALGQASIQTTVRYVNEARPDELAKVFAALRTIRKGG